MAGILYLDPKRALYLVPNADVRAVPTAAGVREVKDFIVINVEVWFSDNAEFAVIVLLPEVPIVIFGHWAAMHAGSFDGDDLA